jgi:hypothetical protein
MKKQVISVLTMLSLVAAVIAAITVAPAAAQAINSIKVDVPFNFTSGSSEFPAGKYTIEQVSGRGTSAITIRSENGKAIGMLICSSAQTLSPKDVTSVVFNRYGDHYFLSQIWTAGETTGIEIPRSSMERRFQRAIQAGNGASAVVSGPAIVTIAAAMPIAR